MTFRNETCQINNFLFDNDSSVTIRCYAGSSAQTYAESKNFPVELLSQPTRLPADLTRIDAEAFLGIGVDLIQIPTGVTSIGRNAFSPGTTLVVTPGSFADQWARENGFAVEY